ncbi:hypothetical protein [Saccharothrix obliqua]|uniref:hypothetical protein n=1 Tax=Saccharothrix obliqua TaxID=2861747 RepID=UPI001C5D9E75|nr:hypothetical protein [Saccharothrix obliqua]MBW4716364.1 hypothetical protein [Saccharothrix obliqua]
MKRIALVVMCLLAAGCGRPVETGTAPVGIATLSSPPRVVEAPVPAKLSPHGQDVLERARRSGVDTISLVISAETGATERVVTALRERGATVEASDASIGYVRVNVPIPDVKWVLAVDGVRQVDVDEPIGLPDPTP